MGQVDRTISDDLQPARAGDDCLSLRQRIAGSRSVVAYVERDIAIVRADSNDAVNRADLDFIAVHERQVFAVVRNECRNCVDIIGGVAEIDFRISIDRQPAGCSGCAVEVHNRAVARVVVNAFISLQ